MAKSRAKKQLEHRLRTTSTFDPRHHRGSWGTVKPVARIKGNKKKDYLPQVDLGYRLITCTAQHVRSSMVAGDRYSKCDCGEELNTGACEASKSGRVTRQSPQYRGLV